VKFSPYTPDLAAVLRNSELSVSMAGYNTVMDVLSSGVRALVYPVTSNGDQEQIVRAEGLEKTGVVDVIRAEQLAPDELARKLEMAVSKPPISLTLNCEGAVNTARLLKKYIAAKRGQSIDASETRRWSQGTCDTERQIVSSLRTENAG
jgi:predicted glycosyltransferase